MKKSTKKNHKEPWTRSQRLAVLVLFFLGLNTLTHVSSPAYRYYKNFCSKLESDNSRFRDQVKNDFIPMLYHAISNRSSCVSSSVSSFISTNVPSVVSCSYHYFIDQGNPAIFLDGRIFHIGDSFDGTPICNISPFVFSTYRCIYQRPINEVKKNDLAANDK